jgi:galactose-1-phosphate uridylyltransferase
MEKALRAFYTNTPLAAWPYIVGVKDGNAILYIDGILSGVTDNNKKYMLVAVAEQLKLETIPYNETWCEIVGYHQTPKQETTNMNSLLIAGLAGSIATNGQKTACLYKNKSGWVMVPCDSVGRELEHGRQFENKTAAKRAAKELNLKPWNY